MLLQLILYGPTLNIFLHVKSDLYTPKSDPQGDLQKRPKQDQQKRPIKETYTKDLRDALHKIITPEPCQVPLLEGTQILPQHSPQSKYPQRLTAYT